MITQRNFSTMESMMVAWVKALYVCATPQDRWEMLQAAKDDQMVYRELASLELDVREVVK